MKLKSSRGNKPTILIFNEYYLPGYKAGGPIRSISNLVSWLGDEYNFKVITTDRDSLDESSYNNITVNSWNKVGKSDVYYMARGDTNISHIYGLLDEIDYEVVYLNSFFGLYFSIIPLLLLKFILNFNPSRILLACRGQFSEGALLQSTYKKKLFIKLSNIFGLHDDIKWHATNLEEKKEIVSKIKISTNDIFIANNLPQKTEKTNKGEEVKKEKGELNIIFLSRIAPKKNLEYALNFISQIESIRITFDIFGNLSDRKYWERCKKIIEALPPNISVNYKGVIKHEKVVPTIGQYHLFLLPTKGENFGHVIYESMLAGTPVLISDKTPWTDLEDKGLGWSISLNEREQFTQVLKNLGLYDQKSMNNLKKTVRKNILDFKFEEILYDYQSMFNALIHTKY